MAVFDKLRNSMGVEDELDEELEDEELEEEEDDDEEEAPPKKKKVKKVSPKKSSKKIPIRRSPKPKEEEEVEVDETPEDNQDWFEPEGELAVDVYQVGDEIIIQSTVAGVSPDDLDVGIENDIVTITGERKNPTEGEDKQYFTQECYWGPFSRQVILPEEVDSLRAEAVIKDGIFILRIPKMQRQRIKKIRVRG